MLFAPPAASFEFLFKMPNGFAALIAGAVPDPPSLRDDERDVENWASKAFKCSADYERATEGTALPI